MNCKKVFDKILNSDSENLKTKFRRKNTLIRKKYLEYVPVLISAYIALIAHGIADNFADALVGNDPMERQYNAKAIK